LTEDKLIAGEEIIQNIGFKGMMHQ
jgi:hypothetical protein